MPGFEFVGEQEFNHLREVFEKGGGVLFRFGFDDLRDNTFKVLEFERKFSRYLGVPDALAVTSGTAALRVALAGLGIGKGDKVITQAFTFVATVEAIVESGATPYCVDVDENLNMCPERLLDSIDEDTRAVIVVHMMGAPSYLSEIKEICIEKGVYLIEDTAWGLGGNYKGQKLGSIGDVGTFSFDHAKALTTGEGGMVVSNDKAILDRARAWHDHGHENNPALPRWKDSRTASGFNFRMSEMQGAVGCAQLDRLPTTIALQRNRADFLWKALDQNSLERRKGSNAGYETSDGLLVKCRDKTTALKVREALVESGFSTKILPEALTWHFSRHWNHIRSLEVSHGGELGSCFESSRLHLERTVALPILCLDSDEKLANIADIVNQVVSKA